VADGVVVAQARATLTAPTGPLASTNQSLATVVILDEAEHRVAAFHNTLVARPVGHATSPAGDSLDGCANAMTSSPG
jgi:hypothetical protein